MTQHEYQLAKQANRERVARKIALYQRMEEQQQARIFAVRWLGHDRVDLALTLAEPTGPVSASPIKTAA